MKIRKNDKVMPNGLSAPAVKGFRQPRVACLAVATAVMTLLSVPAGAQEMIPRAADGGISAEMINEIRSANTPTAADRALFNAVAVSSIDDIARNHAARNSMDTYFSDETPAQSIGDQESSGRCWMFSGLSVIRSDFARRTDSLTVDFSHNYLFFWDQLEKANLFLQGIIDTADRPIDDERVRFFFESPISDGGTFCGVADLTEKYGIVPKELMPETYSSDNTRRMRAMLNSKLREQGLRLREMVNGGTATASDIMTAKKDMLAVVYHMLSLMLGEPPTEFTYAFKNNQGRTLTAEKTYTPLSFWQEVAGTESLNGTFIMVMNDPRREFYKTYEVEYDRHSYDGHNWRYLNLPMNDIASLAIAAIKDGSKLYSSYDVGKFLDRKRGYCDINNYDYEALMGTTFGMNKAERIMTYDSGSTHAMTLTAVDLDDEGKPRKWKAENSWGASWGNNGCLIMTNEWMEEYMFRLVVNKQYVPAKLLKLNEQEPVMVMPEDPLFADDD